jgi:hypothetical protein
MSFAAASIDFQQDVEPKQNQQRYDNEDWQMFHSSFRGDHAG